MAKTIQTVGYKCRCGVSMSVAEFRAASEDKEAKCPSCGRLISKMREVQSPRPATQGGVDPKQKKRRPIDLSKKAKADDKKRKKLEEYAEKHGEPVHGEEEEMPWQK